MSTKTIEELLKIAESNSEAFRQEKVIDGLDEAHIFIKTFKIKDGQHKVLGEMVYKAYKLFAKKANKKGEFLEKFSKFIIPNYDQHTAFYLLNFRTIELLNKVDNFRLSLRNDNQKENK